MGLRRMFRAAFKACRFLVICLILVLSATFFVGLALYEVPKLVEWLFEPGMGFADATMVFLWGGYDMGNIWVFASMYFLKVVFDKSLRYFRRLTE